MGFMDNVSTFTKGVGAKAKGNYDVANLNSQISNLQREIGGLNNKLGDKCYQYFRENTSSIPEEFINEINEINSRYDRIAALKLQVEETKESVAAVPLKYTVNTENGFCSSCGAPLSAGAAFCTKCGAKMVVNTVVEEPIAEANVDEKTDELVAITVNPIVEDNVRDIEPTIITVEENVSEPVENVSIATEEKIFCSNCGAELTSDTVFCTNCGQKRDI